MTKARRMIEEDLRLIDLVIEILDARIPRSSQNPDIDALSNGKARMIILNKMDLADDAMTRAWEAYFQERGIIALRLDGRKSGLRNKLMPLVGKACAERIERNKRRGIGNRPMRALVAGIPNVGKSTFINSFAGKSIAKTGNKPGVTRGKQWIRLQKDLELLDSPGILWPKIDDPYVGRNLALVGTIKDDLLSPQEMGMEVLRAVHDKEAFLARYGSVMPEAFSIEDDAQIHDVLSGIAQSRGFLQKGGVPDLDAAARVLVEEFRKGTLGRYTLDLL